MKSLQESLFDKDLVKKDLKFRDVYELLAGHAGMQVWGIPIGPVFSTTKVTKYKNPYYPETGFLNAFNAGLMGIIADMPAPDQKTINNGHLNYDWCQELLSKLGKYVHRDWKWSFDEKFNVALRRAAKNLIQVVFNYDEGSGVYVYTFKLKNSK